MAGPSLETLEALPSARSVGPIRETGLTVLCGPIQPTLDVVFIHGITGHPEWTWKHVQATFPGYQIEKPSRDSYDYAFEYGSDNDTNINDEDNDGYAHVNSYSRLVQMDEESYQEVYWPRDLIPITAPYARICTYGYDTNLRQGIVKATSQNTLYDIAWDLLVALDVQRRSAPTRPVLFIAHNLGGIVVQEMLRRGRECQSHQQHLFRIFQSTIGIMFFGTPHGGADPCGFLHRVSESIIHASKLKPKGKAIPGLLPPSDRLRELKDDFGPMARAQKWKIHSFQEELGSDSIKGRKVLEDAFSHLNCPAIEAKQHIHANHMDMCRFSGMEDPEYRKVAAAFNRIAHSTIEKMTRTEVSAESNNSIRHPKPSFTLTEEQKRSILDSLKFNQMDARQISIQSAYAETCSWLLEKAEYVDWIDATKFDQHRGFLWVKGKPGTGKSVLLKYALANLRTTASNRIQISFFFNARGNELEKSTIGMYRSLLVQLYEKLPRLQRAFDALGLSPTVATESLAGSIESLKDLFEQTIRLLGTTPIVCCVDALDECDDSQARDMVAFFHRLGDISKAINVRFWVFFTSRHYPHITITKGLHLVLESQKGHDRDIYEYIEKMCTFGNGKMARNLKSRMQEKASGVFLWVVLVVKILNKEHDEGRTMRRLQDRLSEIPSDLHELFRDLLTRDTRNKDELFLCLQWLLFSARPLTPEELYFAILSGTEPEEVIPWDIEEVPRDTIAKFILNSSKGLAESTTLDEPTVQFIHESVRDFLLKEDGLRTVWSDLGENFRGESQDRLTRCCRRYLDDDVMATLDFPAYSELYSELSRQKLADIRQIAIQKFPFLLYSVRYIFYHSDLAEYENTSQGNLLRSLPLTNWIQLYNVIQDEENYKRLFVPYHNLATSYQGLFTPYSPRASLFYVLAESNRISLVKRHFSTSCCFDIEDERYGAPIFAALVAGNNDLLSIMLLAHAANQPPDPFLEGILKPYMNEPRFFTRMDPNFYFNRDVGILDTLSQQGDEIIFAFYLAANRSHIDQPDQSGRTPLSYSAGRGHGGLVQWLLGTGDVNADSKSRTGRTPLSYAAEEGHSSVVRRLMREDGVDPDSESTSGRTPLSYAAEKGHKEIVSLLLATEGVNPDPKDTHKHRELPPFVVERNHNDIAQMLSSTTDINIDYRDCEFEGTCLLWATKHENEPVVKLLLEKNADVDAITRTGRTALALAAENGNGEIAGYLIEKGAHINTSDNLGWTPLLLAAKAGHSAIVRMLVGKNGDIEAADGQFGRSPLSWAAGNGHAAVVQFLLAKGAKTKSADKFGRTPFDHASSAAQMAIVWDLMNV
ncbi:hypothetical protein F4801DRAFT_575466 [Xylaria longipes]|nr:hypothetical protein F4801DRAFT_575466 [Xylaria longipes]RYC57488.1 hypothetical protein CHU98_g8724 [Xylaria longipes]